MTAGDGTVPVSRGARELAIVSGVLFAIQGAILFVAPGWAADRFPWTVSDFVAMTIGGWSLGTAVYAWVVARGTSTVSVLPCLVYLACFGAFELLVVVWHRDVLDTDVALTWLYLAAMVSALATGVVGLVGVSRHDLAASTDGVPVPRWVYGVAIGFAAFVGLLAAGALVAPEGSLADSRLFPQPASKFTFRAFGAFYAALTVSSLTLLLERRMGAIVRWLWAGISLIVPITIAALVYLDTFDLDRRPSRLIYLGAYVVAFIGAAIVIGWDHAVRTRVADPAPAPPAEALARR